MKPIPTFAYIAFILITNLYFSCQEKLMEELIVYSNNFAYMDLEGITSDEGLFLYNEHHVLGPFNNQGFSLSLEGLPEHNMIKINVELYIHNYWNGNSPGVEGPDVWNMMVDGNKIIQTTFSNTPCESTYCLYQSYPENMIRSFPPKTGATNIDLPGLFEQQNNIGWTSLYEISRIIPHKQGNLTLQCFDQLRQENVLIPKEDESWSIGKITISVLNVK